MTYVQNREINSDRFAPAYATRQMRKTERAI